MPLIDERKKIMNEAINNGRVNERIKQQCRDARSNEKNAVEVAKGKWVEHLINKAKLMNSDPKET